VAVEQRRGQRQGVGAVISGAQQQGQKLGIAEGCGT
jgi:hypothetical protein